LNNQTAMLVVLMIVGLAIYKTYRLRNKIICRYTSRSKQTWDVIVPAKGECVFIEKRKFIIIPECIKHHWHWVLGIIPTFMPELDFVWNSKYPVDPNKGQPTVISPEVEEAIDEERLTRAYAHSQNQEASGKVGKLGGLAQYMPYIAIALVVVVAFYFYTQNKAITSDLNVVKLALQSLLNKQGQ